MTHCIRRSTRPSRAALRASPLTLALLTALPAAQAQSARNQLEQVVVTATRSPQPLSQVLADVTVLTSADIERQAYAGVADLLRSQPGFEMSRNGGPGTNTSLYVRGSNNQHTMLMVDGVRVDTQSGSGGTNWLDMPLSQIERIEIVRGPASAIYGSDAIGGVVQIFTRKGAGQKPLVEFGLGAGNLGLAKGDASVSGKSGIVDYALTGALERSDGFDARTTATNNKDRDGYRNHSYSVRLGAQLSAEQRVQLTHMDSHVNSQYDATATQDDRNVYSATVTGLSWLSNWTREFDTQVSIGESSNRYETRPSPYLTETRVRTYALNAGYQLAAGHRLNAVLERREDKLDNSSLSNSPTPGTGDRAQNAVSLGYLMTAGAASLQLHARRDDDSQFGGATTGSAAVGYQLSPQWRMVASYGSAFRAPTLYQLYSPYGLNSLKPERSRNGELAVHFKQGATSASATIYRNEIRNMFDSSGTSCSAGSFCYQNTAKAVLQGVTLSAGTTVFGINLAGSVDLQAPKDATPNGADYGHLLGRRAKERATLRADTDVAGWTLGSRLQLVGQRYDRVENVAKLGGYAVLDLDAQRSLTRTLRVQVKLDNAFDRGYQTASTYNSAPRQFFVGLRYQPDLF